MLPLRARVDLRAMAMKEYSAFPKAPASLEPHHQIRVISRSLVGEGFYPSTKKQSVYSTARANRAIFPCLFFRRQKNAKQELF